MAYKCMFIPCFQDVIFGCKSIKDEVILLVVYNLLGVVEKLHKAEIVHGDLRPEIFFLGDRLGYVYESNQPFFHCLPPSKKWCRMML